MNDANNPYQPGQSGSVQSFHTQGLDPEAVRAKLNGMRGWVRLFGVLMFFGAGMLVVGGIGMLAGGAVMMGNEELTKQGFPGWMFPLLGAVYLLMAVLYIFPALYLNRCASAIREFDGRGEQNSALMALEWMRKFWKFVGILVIVAMALYIIAIPVFVVFGGIASAAAKARETRIEQME